MNPVNKPNIDKSKIGNNPFIRGLQIKVYNKNIKGLYALNMDTYVPETVSLDSARCTKLFISADYRKIVAGLSGKAKSMLLWIMFEIKLNEDYIWINKDRYKEENSVDSHSTYLNAIKELIRYEFLSSTTVKDVYWINPEIFFNGNRARVFTNNLVATNE